MTQLETGDLPVKRGTLPQDCHQWIVDLHKGLNSNSAPRAPHAPRAPRAAQV